MNIRRKGSDRVGIQISIIVRAVARVTNRAGDRVRCEFAVALRSRIVLKMLVREGCVGQRH